MIQRTASPVGNKFHRLTVKQDLGIVNGYRRWLCQCECGAEKKIIASHVRHGHTKSCGCLHIESAKATAATTQTHGLTNSPEYRVWSNMRNRCTNRKCKEFKYYGGRGVQVCERWMNSFEAFYEDMGPRPSRKHSIDRINNHGDYEPGNCRWVVQRTQMRNTSQNHVIEHDGRSVCLEEWSELTGLPASAIRKRLKRGWPVKDALETPLLGKGYRHDFKD